MTTSHSDDLSLYDIAAGLQEALAAREDAATPEEQATADQAIAAYMEAEVSKVDGIAAYARHCRAMHAEAKAEAERLTARAAAWDGRRKRLLDFVQRVMEQTGRRRIEGKLSTLLLQANGGKQAVRIDDESLLPDEYCDVEGKIPAWIWRQILMIVEKYGTGLQGDQCRNICGLRLARVPRLAAIAEALAQPCQDCQGDGKLIFGGHFNGDVCPACGGSGKAGVPGATLLPRGEHVDLR